jgi:hypothetical protein
MDHLGGHNFSSSTCDRVTKRSLRSGPILDQAYDTLPLCVCGEGLTQTCVQSRWELSGPRRGKWDEMCVVKPIVPSVVRA